MNIHRSHPARAAGMTEYLVIVVLIAIGVLVGVQGFGWTVENQYDGAALEVDLEVSP